MSATPSPTMIRYDWTCLACEADNARESTRCTRCGCAAAATAAEVDRARQTWRQRSGLPPLERFDLFAEARTLPWLPIGFGVLLVLGGLALIVSPGASFTAFGALLLALSALCLSSYRPAAPR